MYDFNYHRPNSVRRAVAMMDRAEDAKFIAGGHTLLPTMKQRLAAPSDLIDLGGIEGLRGVELKGRTLHVGALTPHAEVASSSTVHEAIPALAKLAGGIGDPHVRQRGTIGGSIANNDPNADYPAACLGLGATIVTNRRRIAADDFFTGMFETALEEDEIIVRVLFPVPRRAGYEKFANTASRYALVGVFVSKRGGEVRAAVTGAGSCVFRSKELEQALSGRFATKSLEGVKIPADDLNSDIHASADYRSHLVTVMARRAVGAA